MISLSLEDWCIDNGREDLLKEWNYEKNDKSPRDVGRGSAYNAWWVCHFDDKRTGKHFDFEWQTAVKNRVSVNSGCPYLMDKAIFIGFNDLATTNPELVAEWHPTKNGDLTPYNVVAGSAKKVWWLLPYDDEKTGKHYQFEWVAEIRSRAKDGMKCPYLSGQKVYKGFNDLATTHPDIAKEWHPIKNGSLTPYDIIAGSEKKVWWLLPYDDPITGKHFDFEWESPVDKRCYLGHSCPYLSNQAILKGFNDIATTHPNIAKEWHPTKNRSITPYSVSKGSKYMAWWKCQTCQKDWVTSVSSRCLKKSGCPYCNSSKAERLTARVLTDLNVDYESEYKFSNNLEVSNYPYDFYIKDLNIVIELDGIQHFEYLEFFHKNKNGFEKRIRIDNSKNKFCFDNNIVLLRIPYTYDAVEDEETIRYIITDFVSTKGIPKDIFEFYRTFEFCNYSELFSKDWKRMSA